MARMPTEPGDSAVSINVDVLQTQLGERVIATLLDQLQPAVAAASEQVGETVHDIQRDVERAGTKQSRYVGGLVVSLALACWMAWSTYQEDKRTASEERKATAAQYKEIADGLGSLHKGLSDDRVLMRRVICDQHDKIQDLYRIVSHEKAQPTRCPFPDADAISSATR